MRFRYAQSKTTVMQAPVKNVIDDFEPIRDTGHSGIGRGGSAEELICVREQLIRRKIRAQ